MLIRRLRDLREDKDLTQKQVAEFLRIPERTYGNYEMGVRNIPIEFLIELSNFYEVSVDYLLDLTNQKKRYTKK